jgi:hypothetical protein
LIDFASAASGTYPLAAIRMIQKYNKVPGKKRYNSHCRHLSLGKMLNRYYQTLRIPLLKIVRNEEQA